MLYNNIYSSKFVFIMVEEPYKYGNYLISKNINWYTLCMLKFTTNIVQNVDCSF